MLAVTVAIGLTVAYYSIRAGAEEFLLNGQQSLREWVVGTHLSIRQILCGSLMGHGMQTLHHLVLSSPLLCIAYAVGGGSWELLALCLGLIVLQAFVFWLIGALTYLLIGHEGQSTFVTLRVLVAGICVGSAIFVPWASHFRVSVHLLEPDIITSLSTKPLEPHLAFVLVHAVLCVVLSVLVAALLARYRRNTAIADTQPPTSSRY